MGGTTGSVGIGTTSPSLRMHVVSTASASYPATSGATQTGGVLRLQGPNNVILDAGENTTNGFWLQSTNKNDLSTNYPLLLNPNGGNVGI